MKKLILFICIIVCIGIYAQYWNIPLSREVTPLDMLKDMDSTSVVETTPLEMNKRMESISIKEVDSSQIKPYDFTTLPVWKDYEAIVIMKVDPRFTYIDKTKLSTILEWQMVYNVASAIIIGFLSYIVLSEVK